MPATAQTWRNQRVLHGIFAVTGTVLLAATVWMFAEDHWRPWKAVQRKADQIRVTTAEWRRAQSEAESLQAEQKRLAVARAEPATRRPDGKSLSQDQEGDLRSTVSAGSETRAERGARDGARARPPESNVLEHPPTGDPRAAEALAQNRAALRQLEASIQERRSTYFTWYGFLPLPGKRWLELPLLDALNSPRKIETIWHEGLEIDYNFRKVRRFDRCTTCHGFADKTAAGSAYQPAYAGEQLLEFVVPWPEDRIAGGGSRADAPSATETSAADRLAERLGVRLAADGLLERNAVTVQFVRPESPAARATPVKPAAERIPQTGRSLRESLLRPAVHPAIVPIPFRGLIAGDVIRQINGVSVADRDETLHRLLAAADAGEPLTLAVRRGLPSPFASHPRLGLFVGSASPHPQAVFGCTVCHEGQGSATDFKWASHTPNDAAQRRAWRAEHRWFDNPDWVFPMYPRRFAESACLKCHHEMGELAASERFAEPPAPKLSRGYQLILRTAASVATTWVVTGPSSASVRI